MFRGERLIVVEPVLCVVMSFDKFASGRSSGDDPRVSLRKSGSIGFNATVLNSYFDGAEGVEVYYNEEDNIVGFHPVETVDGESYTLQRTGNTGSVTPLSFLNRYGLTPNITTHYEPEEYTVETDDGEEVTIIGIDVDNPVGTFGSPDDDDE